jgi:acetate kinase
MKILVSNIGSSSFKFRLFEMSADREAETAVGDADRIGAKGGVLKLRIGDSPWGAQPRDFADHGGAIQAVLDALVAGGALGSPKDLDAVAFKAVMAGDVEPVVLVDQKLLARMEYFIPVAPAHNPPYIAAMRMFRKVLGDTPLVAAFETGFHRTVPARRRFYAVPPEWAEKYGVKRYGFHGASHRYIATRTGQLMPEARRVISCHLGGSSSLCAIRDGASVAVSMGLSPQSGLPQSNRAGDFDPFALLLLKSQAGMDTEQVLAALGSASGLAALSGTSGDMRDVYQQATGNGQQATDSRQRATGNRQRATGNREQATGNGQQAAGGERARLAIDIYVTAIRDYLGAYLVELGGADAIVFTGGIGENNPWLRTEVLAGLEFAGIRLDERKNASARGECRIESADSMTAVWVMPTNEELIVARLATEMLRGGSQS